MTTTTTTPSFTVSTSLDGAPALPGGFAFAGGLVSELSPEQALVGLDRGRFITDADENLTLARHAARQRLPALHLIDGRLPHALVAELFTEQGIGALITRQVR